MANDLEKPIKAIEARNERVELDKQWETSWTRRVAIVVLTYGVVVAWLFIIENDSPLINATVTVIGFVLSTLAVVWLRKLWQRQR